MLSTKPTTVSSKEPDPASSNLGATQLIFIQDEPEPLPAKKEEEEIVSIQLANRVQGAEEINLDGNKDSSKQTTQYTAETPLSDEYAKALQNQTDHKEQDENGDVNFDTIENTDNDTLDTIEQKSIREETPISQDNPQLAKNQIEPVLTKDTPENLSSSTPARLSEFDQTYKTLLTTSIKPSTQVIQPIVQKIISKKHRPADIGNDNRSQIQLTKSTESQQLQQKKKMSLQELQNGFSTFLKNNNTTPTQSGPTASTLGNSLFFSSSGNAQEDNIAGLKYASYMHQAGNMYNNAGLEYHDRIINIIRKEGMPSENNQVRITIERSGKISNMMMILSCGNSAIDNYHIKMIENIGDFPPVPKYIPTPIEITAQLPFKSVQSRPISYTTSQTRR